MTSLPIRTPFCARAARATRLLAALAIGLFAVFAGSLASASADPTGDADAAAQAFDSGVHVYVSPQSGQSVDAAELKSKIGKEPLYIAIVAPNQAPEDVANQITTTFNPTMTIAVISGTDSSASSTYLCDGDASKLLTKARSGHTKDIADGKLTGWLTSFAAKADDAPTKNSGDCASGAGGSSGAGSVLPWMIGIGVVGLAAIAYYVVRKKKQKEISLRGRRAEVSELYNRLADELPRLGTATERSANPAAGQALADAAERYDAAGGILSAAETDSDLDAARAACIEGLTATRFVRRVVGMKPGGDLPALDKARAQRLARARRVRVGDETYDGYPDYTPGAPRYFRGDQSAPAGWYAVPFWESEFIGTTLGGGLFGGNEVEFEDDEWDDDGVGRGGPSAGRRS